MQDNKVVWLEGMFLEPQHFQMQDRYHEHLLHTKIHAINAHHWGFSEIEIDEQLLAIGKLGLRKAKGFFQDGTFVDIPVRDRLPVPFQIPAGMINTIFYLAIPMRELSAETGENDTKELYRYHMSTIEVKDSSAGNANTTEIQVGSLSCHIFSEQDDRSSFHCLQFAKILESRANYFITLDKDFLPHAIDIHAHKNLSQLIHELYGLLNHRAEALASRLNDMHSAGTAEAVDLMMLQLVNRYEPILHYLQYKTSIHPEFLFHILVQLMGEITTFTHEKRRPDTMPIYHHHNLYDTFQPIVRELRNALNKVLEQNAVSIPLYAKQLGLWTGQFQEQSLISECTFILAVYADLPIEVIQKTFAAHIKIAPVEQIQAIVSRQLPGVDIQLMNVVPRKIPYHANFLYFVVNTKHELWKALDKSSGIALHIGKNFPELKLELWAIKG